MAKFAVLNEWNKVGNIILADTLETALNVTNAKCIEISDEVIVHMNSSYDEETNTFQAPVVPKPVQVEEITDEQSTK